jgi:uncharacterized repeat protein (TIGR01451 family)
MTSRIGWQAPVTVLAAVVLVAVLLFAPEADTAPGDLADLAVSKADNPDPVLVGAVLTYTIQVTNLGPQNATGVTVTDRLPKHVDFVSATTSSGTCDRRGSRVTCDVGALAADPTKANAVTVTIQVRPTRAGTIKNTASVDSVENDPIGANDRAEVSTTVTAPPLTSSCRGIPATVTGTRGSDRLVGTGGPDVIAGLGGGDVIAGLAGRDLICAGGGDDRVTAGSAADRAFGGTGADRLLGRGGRDLLAGNPGRDVLAGNRGDDRLRGGRGFDRCFGGSGRDIERSCEGG